ncbi:unnamed protein product, partial [Meganyctiphanes norvegica]
MMRMRTTFENILVTLRHSNIDMNENIIKKFKNGASERFLTHATREKKLLLKIKTFHLRNFISKTKMSETTKDTEMESCHQALHLAARNNRLGTCQELIQRKAPLKTLDNQGYTPLLTASRSGNALIVQLLMKAGAR